MSQTWFSDPELMSTTFSVSHVTNNLSKADDVLAYVHMDDVVYVNAAQSPFTAHKLPIKDKSFVHQVRLCRLQSALFVVVASDAGIQVFDSKGEQKLHELQLKDAIDTPDDGTALFCRGICAIDSDHPAIVVGSSTGKVFVLGKESSSKSTSDHEFDLVETLGDHKEAIQSADSSPNGVHLATSDSSGTILVRNTEKAFDIIHRITGDSFPATSIRFTSESLLICGYLTGAIKIYRKGDYCLHAEVAAHSRAITSLDVSDNYIVSVGEDTYINVWELTGNKTSPRVHLSSSQCVPNDLLVGTVFMGSKSIVTAAYDTTHLKSWVAQ